MLYGKITKLFEDINTNLSLTARNSLPGCSLPTGLIVSVLVVDAHLGKPRIYGQHFHFFSTSKFIFLPDFPSFFSYPI